MATYTFSQWVLFFYIYCFLGWVWESAYVSVKERHLVNRGFLKGPLLPIYGTGALCILIATIPIRDNVPLMCLTGMISATVLEYVTGAVMEKMFHVRYWDYTGKFMNLNGHICLASTLCWGVMTVLVVDVFQVYLEQLVLAIDEQIVTIMVFAVTPFVTADLVTSFRAAIHLRDLLIQWERAREELEKLSERRTELEKALVARRAELEKAVNEQRVVLEKTVNEQRAVLEKTVNEQRAVLEKTVNEQRTVMEKAVNEPRTVLEKTVSEQREALESAVSNRVQGLESAMTEKKHGLESAVTDRVQGLENAVTAKKQGLQTAVTDRVQGLESAVTEHKQELQSAVNDSMRSLESILGEWKLNFAELMNDRKEDRAAELEKDISSNESLFLSIRELMDKITAVQEKESRLEAESDLMRQMHSKSVRGLLKRNPNAVSFMNKDAFADLKQSMMKKQDETKAEGGNDDEDTGANTDINTDGVGLQEPDMQDADK